MLASLVEMQEHGEKNRQVGQGWKKLVLSIDHPIRKMGTLYTLSGC